MEYHNEQERYIAILEASLPYVAPQSRHAIQLLLQSHSVKIFRLRHGENLMEKE